MVSETIKLPYVSVIAIGRNEAENLPACIRSIKNMNYPQDHLEIIYVDTNSSDNSPEIAKSLGATVYEESTDFPSAALARNRGLKEAKYDVIHYVDSDMVVGRNYLREAVKYLGSDNIVCVIGRINEKGKKSNWITKVLVTDWKVKETGFIDAPGAGGTFLKKALLQVGGYNPRLPVGEETDLGSRLRRNGHTILLIDEGMGTHDYGVPNIRALLSRFYRSGRNFGLIMVSDEVPKTMKKPGYKLLFQGAFCIAAMPLFALATNWKWLLLLIAAIPFLLVGFVTLRYKQVIFSRRCELYTFLYFYLAYVMKPVLFFGLLTSLRHFFVNKRIVL